MLGILWGNISNTLEGFKILVNFFFFLQGIDHGFIHQTWPLNSFDELSSLSMAASAFGEHYQMQQHSSDHHQIFSQKHSLELSENGVLDRPVKQQKTNSWSSSNSHLSNPQIDGSPNYHVVNSGYTDHHHQSMVMKPKEEIISMNFPRDLMVSQGSIGNQNYVFKTNQGAKSLSPKARLTQAQDHIMAERKRREKLSQRFIQLSALVPGLKKVQFLSLPRFHSNLCEKMLSVYF